MSKSGFPKVQAQSTGIDREQVVLPKPPDIKLSQTPGLKHPEGLLGEQLLRLDAIASFLPRNKRGKKVGLSSIYRWCDRGVRGVRLEYLKAPFGRITSLEALERFLMKLNEGGPGVTALTPTRRKREIEQAGEYVKQMLRLDEQEAV